MRDTRIVTAEAVGTLILILGGPGTAVLAAGSGALDGAATLGVALAFGLALLIAAYAIGHVSGCHINPAVTLGMVAGGKLAPTRAPAYLLGQVIGGVGGGFLVWVLAESQPRDFSAEPETFATNLWGEKYGFASFGGMVLAEIVFTAVLVFVVLATTRRSFPPGQIGLTVGLTLALIHLISIPIDNTSVNPVRSLAMAVFAGGDAVEQLWAFIVFPLVGALVGVAAWLALDDERNASEAPAQAAG